jgi:hypothetical protein
MIPESEDAFSMPSSHVVLDQVETVFDDEHAVASAGLLLAATLAERLGIEQAADRLIDLGERPGAHRPGRKLLTLVHTMIAGGDGIDDADLKCSPMGRGHLTNEQWARLEPLLPKGKKSGRPPTWSKR